MTGFCGSGVMEAEARVALLCRVGAIEYSQGEIGESTAGARAHVKTAASRVSRYVDLVFGESSAFRKLPEVSRKKRRK